MAVLQYRTLSNRTVAALTVERDTVFWDRELTGFGVRVYPTGGKVYVAQARGPDGPKRVTVGRCPVLGAEQARQRAALIIARVKAGEDPVPLPLAAKFAGVPTVADLARRYLEEHVAVRCKPKTARTARSVVNRHIVPALGRLPLAAVERRHVMELHESLCETPAMANMTVETLTHMYALARGWDMAPEDCDPCRSIPMNPKRRRERFLTDAEFTRLGQVLDEVSGKGSRVSAGAVATIRLLMLTGCRRNEILTLRWEHVDQRYPGISATPAFPTPGVRAFPKMIDASGAECLPLGRLRVSRRRNPAFGPLMSARNGPTAFSSASSSRSIPSVSAKTGRRTTQQAARPERRWAKMPYNRE